MKTKITRTTDSKFTKVLTRGDGKIMELSILKGSTEYANACANFHKNGVALEIGNAIES